MNKITTHKGDTLILIEVPLDAYDFKLSDDYINGFQNDICLVYEQEDGFTDITIMEDSKYNADNFEIIGTTSTLTDKDVEPFVEQIIYVVKPYKRNTYHSYTSEYETINTALESWDSFLKANNIDTTKNWVVLKVKND